MNTSRLWILVGIVLFSACVGDQGDDVPDAGIEPTACEALLAETTPTTDVWEVRVAGDVKGGTTYRCDESTTWSQNPRRDARGELGAVVRDRLAPAGECRWASALEARRVGDPTAGTCAPPSRTCAELRDATEPAPGVAEVAIAGVVDIADDQDFYGCQHPVTDADLTWTSSARRIKAAAANVIGAIVVTDGVGQWCRFAPAVETRDTFVGMCDGAAQ